MAVAAVAITTTITIPLTLAMVREVLAAAGVEDKDLFGSLVRVLAAQILVGVAVVAWLKATAGGATQPVAGQE